MKRWNLHRAAAHAALLILLAPAAAFSQNDRPQPAPTSQAEKVTRKLKLQHVDPATALSRLRTSSLPKGIDGILGYALDNSLIAQGSEAGIEALGRLVAQIDVPAAQAAPAERRVTMSLHNVSLGVAVRMLFQDTNISYRVAPEVAGGPITVSIRGMGWESALRVLVRTASTPERPVEARREGETWVIGPPAGKAAAPVVLKVPLHFISAEDAAARLTGRILPDGVLEVQPVPSDNSLLVKGSAPALEQLRSLLRLLDIPARSLLLVATVTARSPAGEPLVLRGVARTLNNRQVELLEEQSRAGSPPVRMLVRLKPTVQGDGEILVESEWDLTLPVHGGAAGPLRLVKRLTTVARLNPGQAAAVGEMALSPWGGQGVVRLWLRADFLKSGGAEAVGPAGERLGKVLLVGGEPYLHLPSLAGGMSALARFSEGRYVLIPRPPRRPGAREAVEPDPPSAGPHALMGGRARVSGLVRVGALPINTSGLVPDPGGDPYVPLADVAAAAGSRVRFDPLREEYTLHGGNLPAALLSAAP